MQEPKELSSHLRNANQGLHRSLENHSYMRRLQGPQASYADYLVMAERMFPRLLRLERELQKSLDLFGIQREAFNALRTECEALNLKDHSRKDFPENMNFALALLYVLEGSGLGAKMMMQKWQKIFPAETISKMHYYSYLSELPSSRWPMVKNLIDTRSLSETDRAQVIKFSMDIFTFLGSDDGTH